MSLCREGIHPIQTDSGMKHISICIISLWVGILAVSCGKSGPEAPETSEGIPMSFGPAAVSRSANLLDTDNINTSGNQLTVYDLYTTSEQSVLYMDATPVTCDGSGNWTYSPLKYWTETGTHAFTAYLSKQNGVTLDGTNYPTVTYYETMDALGISQWEITPTNQFDFLYAWHSRNMETVANPHAPVEFSLNHLLCAVQFNVVNLMPTENVELNNFRLSGLRKGKAVITKGVPEVTLSSDSDIYNLHEDVTNQPLEYNKPHKLFSDDDDDDEGEGYVLLWPHTKEVFGGLTGKISYMYENTEVSKQINLIDGGTNNWRAGQKYTYNFYIQDNRISLSVEVVPWKTDDVIIAE